MSSINTTIDNSTKFAFLFPGQGSQVVGMGKELYDNSPAAKLVFDEIDDALNQPLSKYAEIRPLHSENTLATSFTHHPDRERIRGCTVCFLFCRIRTGRHGRPTTTTKSKGGVDCFSS